MGAILIEIMRRFGSRQEQRGRLLSSGLLAARRWRRSPRLADRSITARAVDKEGYSPSGKSPPPAKGSRKRSSRGGIHPEVATNPRLMNAGLP